MCHLHGGEVGVSSKTGEGSTFGFFFRVKHTAQPEDQEGWPDDHDVDHASLRHQIKQLGNVVPKEADEGLVDESLKNPPIEDTGDMAARTHRQQDAKYQRTARIASNVRQKHGLPADPRLSFPLNEGSTVDRHCAAVPTCPGPNKGNDIRQMLSHPTDASGARTAAQVHILLVEDNIINQRIVSRKLERKGYKVTTANNGREAVELFQSAPKRSTGDQRAFDICLMDMEMPVMDGNSATKNIRALEKQDELEHIYILGVTANVRGEQQTEM